MRPRPLGRSRGGGHAAVHAIGELADRLVAPAPAARLGVLRLLVGGYATVYLLVRLPHLWSETRLPGYRWAPVGVLGPVTSPPPSLLVAACFALALASGIGFTLGLRWRASGPLFGLAALASFSFGLSWGHILHTEHLVALHLLVLALAPAADACSLDARNRARQNRAGRGDSRSPTVPEPGPESEAEAGPESGSGPGPAGRYGFPVRLVSLITVLTYVLAGWMKLRNGGWAWLSGDVLRNQVAFDNLRKVVLGDRWSHLGAWLVAANWFWRPVALATLVVELGAPVALLGGRWRNAWVAAAWSFHLGTLLLMAIMFPYPLSGVAFASLFPLERLSRASPRRRRSRSVDVQPVAAVPA